MAESKKYAIIIDSGSSGSRALVYEYYSDSKSDPFGLPIIKQIWNFKIKPGLSTFGHSKSKELWNSHFKKLIEGAQNLIPKNLHKETPIFVQATAGMRLLPTKERDNILKNTCKTLKKNTDFIIEPCNEHVQVIDGDTEGIYGWLALNYLTNRLKNIDTEESILPYGFMDMGGASTQLAFVPSMNEQLDKHKDDMYTINLRSNNGNTNSWSVFVSSWLGFGANEARRRQLDSLINALPKNINYDGDGDGKYDLVDPCSPVGMKIEVEYNNKPYTVTGSGEYEGCLKTIYPLLLKHLPCKDEPCLFNGIHAPSIDFSKEKFVGVSEYWYTANDVFKLSGEYNYEAFEEATKEFCNTKWDTIYERFQNGEYGENLTADLLRTSCFKASWIVNVLHEGFDIPRLGLDDSLKNENKLIENKEEPIFKSVNSIDGNELSWTLGKMVLYSSSQTNGGGAVGIIPGDEVLKSIHESKIFNNDPINDRNDISNLGNSVLTLSLITLLGCFLYLVILRKFGKFKSFIKYLKHTGINKNDEMEELNNLEEGRSLSHKASNETLDGGRLRTRSTMNLHEMSNVNSNTNIENNINSNSINVDSPPMFDTPILKNSFTFTSFRDPSVYANSNRLNFKLGNGSQISMKSLGSI